MLKAFLDESKLEAGCDEAGRGCLAGPVVAAAVILPKDFHSKELNDSKQLSEKKRKTLREEILNNAIAHAHAFVFPEEIDRINILNASFLAMHKAIQQLRIVPESLLIDGNRFNPYPNIPHHCIVKGDAKFLSIAAASILAKTYRDDHMEDLHQKHPAYHWSKNKGYPTVDHRKAILETGITEHHRRSYTLLPTQYSLDL